MANNHAEISAYATAHPDATNIDIGKRFAVGEGTVRRARKWAQQRETGENEPIPIAQARVITRQKRQIDKLTEQAGQIAVLAEAFAKNARALPMPKSLIVKGKAAYRESEMVALVSDAHAVTSWTKAMTNGQSEYNFDIFANLLWFHAQELIYLKEILRGGFGVKNLHIDLLGDFYHGKLRLDDEVCNDYGTTTGVCLTAHVLLQYLYVLAGHFEHLTVRCMAGNHGRLDAKKQSQRYVEENLDSLVYCMMKLAIMAQGHENRIEVIIPGGRHDTFERMGHRITIAHGDHIRGGNGIAGIPIFGLSRDLLRKHRQEVHLWHQSQEGRQEGVKVFEYGHFHNNNFLEDCVMMNGSICPAGPYAVDDLGAISQQKQWVYLTSQEHARGLMVDLSLKAGANKPSGFAYDAGQWIGTELTA